MRHRVSLEWFRFYAGLYRFGRLFKRALCLEIFLATYASAQGKDLPDMYREFGTSGIFMWVIGALLVALGVSWKIIYAQYCRDMRREEEFRKAYMAQLEAATENTRLRESVEVLVRSGKWGSNPD